MILSFRCNETQRIFLGETSARFPPDIQTTARRKLQQLNVAISINDMRAPPGNRLERLQGDRAGQFSIRINQQWRVCFDWLEAGAENVEIVDYH